MPAINPARLRQQAALVADHFNDPAAFARSLHHLLEFYSEQAQRPGQSGRPPPLLAAYKVRPPVLRQLLLELAPLAQENPAAALALCDALWEQAIFEFCEVAIGLLGQIPCDEAEPILHRLRRWLNSSLEPRLIDSLFRKGMSCLYRKNPQVVADFTGELLASKDVFDQQMGLRALSRLILEPGFDNLPICFSLIQPLVRSTPRSLRPELVDIITALAHQSSQEVAYFLRQNLAMPDHQDAAWLIRQTQDEFPGELRRSLRMAERETAELDRKIKKVGTGLPR